MEKLSSFHDLFSVYLTTKQERIYFWEDAGMKKDLEEDKFHCRKRQYSSVSPSRTGFSEKIGR